MNIILLSGGSGKRLWPLSNVTRSKQFLRLLKNDENEFESMVQRVYRQIKTVCPESQIVVATGAGQTDSIHSQLGHQVDIVIEPQRRDTFPAIALSCAYLSLKKNKSDDEVVLVLPVDPYAEIAYFETLSKMEKAAQEDLADIILMGIKPTYPSAKYGYILPKEKSEGKVYPVERFIEKPSEEKAAALIQEGAVWNGGVFAFKLGYLMKMVHANLSVETYEDVLRQYDQLNKISFDYQVVEKANSVAMIPYEGKWKDLGTWNTLSEEMDNESMGNVTLGENTEGTNVINELSIPVVVLGAKNMIIAASPDGILISDKSKSSYLKSYLDDINERPMFEERIWGEAKILDLNTYENNKKSLTKHISVRHGQNISYHSHNVRDEIWTFVDGYGDLVIDGHVRNVRPGDLAYIHKGQKHSLRAVTDVRFIEVQIGEELAREDVDYCDWKW